MYNEPTDPELNRNEFLVARLHNFIAIFPDFIPYKTEVQEHLYNLNDMIRGLRPPRIVVIGRSRSGKSSLINAICGLRVAEVSDTKPETGKASWKKYYHNGVDLLHILDTRGLQ